MTCSRRSARAVLHRSAPRRWRRWRWRRRPSRPSVTRAAAVVVGAAVVAVAAPGSGRRRRPATVVVEPSGTSTPPASPSSIERKMRKPATTAITASTMLSVDPTGEPESPTRVDVRPRSAWAPRRRDQSDHSLLHSLGVTVDQRAPSAQTSPLEATDHERIVAHRSGMVETSSSSASYSSGCSRTRRIWSSRPRRTATRCARSRARRAGVVS